LYDKLKDNVFDAVDIKMINKVKQIINLKSVLLKLKARGVPIVSAMGSDKFVECGKSLCHTIEGAPDDVLKAQHIKFLKKLAHTYNDMPQKDLDILSDKLYEDIELVMQITTAASVAVSVESVVESVVSNQSRTEAIMKCQ